jgi:DNA-binding NtrC family response regulator
MGEKILLVDDEQDFLDVMSERMRNRGMDVTTASSAKEALEMVKDQTFDAIIVDLLMPEMDGLEALENMKKINSDLQVILLTGNATVEKGIEAMKLGAMDLVEKPADMNSLTEKIKKAKAHKMILVERKTEEKIRKIMSSKAW